MDKISTRVIKEAEYIIKTKKTLREASSYFKVSKSTIHKDMQDRLGKFSPHLEKQVKKILQEHKMERHIKGGEKTKEKYKQKRM